jgi:hypothetical protein
MNRRRRGLMNRRSSGLMNRWRRRRFVKRWRRGLGTVDWVVLYT